MLLNSISISLVAALLLSACGTVKSLNPFKEERINPDPVAPANSITYQCEQFKRFYLRKLDKESNAVWLILPDRELRLERTGTDLYSNGIAVLNTSPEAGSLSDGALRYTGCKIAGK
ncbi:hypothetical protein [Methylobacillus flagellatus]|uniref:hypothetical protein n=1 Tax=Methylobacillus flagellatus TaxID=405 RepID=UPI0010F6BD38|nr:hypothetical protein [Methylobacillus flagellatus]